MFQVPTGKEYKGTKGICICKGFRSKYIKTQSHSMVLGDGKHFYWELSFIQAEEMKRRVCHRLFLCRRYFITSLSQARHCLDMHSFGKYLFCMTTTSERFPDSQWKFKPTIYLSTLLDCYLIVCTVYKTSTIYVLSWILPAFYRALGV